MLGLVTVMFAAQKGFTGGFSAFHIAVVAGVVRFQKNGRVHVDVAAAT